MLACSLQEGLAEELRTAILEALYQIDQTGQLQESEAQQFAPVSETLPELPLETYGDVVIVEAPATLPSTIADGD